MDLDLAQVRAFVVAADRRGFGQAATELFVSQQALSKRIQRLERLLGEPLFVRTSHGVELTETGRRFLPHARRLLAEADDALAVVRRSVRPLRVDVWSEVLAPLTVVRRGMEEDPGIVAEVSARRNFPAALRAVRDGELDAAFGRVCDLGRDWADDLACRPVFLQAYQSVVGAEHPLAEEEALRPADLRETGVWFPLGNTTPELLGLFQRYSDEFGVPLDVSGANLGLEHILAGLREDPSRVTVVAAHWELPADSGLRALPLSPAPQLLWSIAWQAGARHPVLDRLLAYADKTGRAEGWLHFDPERHWLPAPDRTALP